MSIFDSIPKPKVPRSRKKMPHYNLFSTDYGRIVPFELIEVVPGDKWRGRSEVFVNTAPMITAPYIENDIRMDYFFVPNRILWKYWEDFITGGVDGVDDYEKLTLSLDSIYDSVPEFFNAGTLWDFFNLATRDVVGDDAFQSNDLKVDALPFLAYLKIWQEYYRDQNWQVDLSDDLDNVFNTYGDVSSDILSLFMSLSGGLPQAKKDKFMASRGWRKDYFTAALPTPQRGPEVPINFDSTVRVPVECLPNNDGWVKLTRGLRALYGDDLIAPDEWATPNSGEIVVGNGSGVYLRVNEEGDIKQVSQEEVSGGGLHVYSADQIEDVYAPLGAWLRRLTAGETTLSSSTNPLYVDAQNFPAITINDLRRANAIQVFLERNMRAGARYVEQILSHFGVKVPDYRLDRPEYIGGFSQPLSVKEIMQNSQTTFGEGGSALGSYAGKGRSGSPGKKLKYRVEEHGYIMGLMTVMPKAVYTGGIGKMWRRESRYDYYFPEFANLGEQEVKSSELWLCGDQDGLVEQTFGYNPRYSEYQWIPNQVHGDFLKSGMKHFTQYRQFTPGNPPSNGDSFLAVKPDSNGINRIWAVEDDGDYDHFWVTVYNHVNMKRPMPRWGTPKLKA